MVKTRRKTQCTAPGLVVTLSNQSRSFFRTSVRLSSCPVCVRRSLWSGRRRFVAFSCVSRRRRRRCLRRRLFTRPIQSQRYFCWLLTGHSTTISLSLLLVLLYVAAFRNSISFIVHPFPLIPLARIGRTAGPQSHSCCFSYDTWLKFISSIGNE